MVAVSRLNNRRFAAVTGAKCAAFVVVAGAGVFALQWYDVPLMRFRYRLMPDEVSGLLDQVLTGLRDFGQIVTFIVVIAVVAAFDARRRRIITALVISQALAWVGYQIPKHFVARYRPWAAIERVSPLERLAVDDTWLESRVGLRGDAIRSFPSGHSAASFALAAVLGTFYGRLRWLLWLLAVGCALSRYLDAVHWPSDCWTGAALGFSAAWLVGRIQAARSERNAYAATVAPPDADRSRRPAEP